MEEQKNKEIRRQRKRRYYGEDHELFREKKRESSYSNDNICDKHIDGA